MGKKIKTKASKPISIDEENMTVEVVMTTNSVDRDRDVIETKGIDTTSFEENPVVLWAHDSRQPPIGVVTDLVKSDNMLTGTVKFADTLRGQEIFKLYKDGIMKTWSIGFQGIDVDYRVDKDGDIEGYNFKSSELLELSAVPVPANAEALTRAYKGIKDESLKEALSSLIPEKKIKGKVSIDTETKIFMQDENDVYVLSEKVMGDTSFEKTLKEKGKDTGIISEISLEASKGQTEIFFDVIKEEDGVIKECRITEIKIFVPTLETLTPEEEPSRDESVIEEEDAQCLANKEYLESIAKMKESILCSTLV